MNDAPVEGGAGVLPTEQGEYYFNLTEREAFFDF